MSTPFFKLMYHQLWALVYPERNQASKRRWKKSLAGKAAVNRENNSPKGRARKKRYWRSEKGKANAKAYAAVYYKTPGGRAVNLRKTLKWQTAHPEHYLLIKRVFGAARRQRMHCKIDFLAISKVYARARELRRWFDVVVDHIIPLSKGGAHSPENLQIIYDFENATKGARLDYKPSVVFT